MSDKIYSLESKKNMKKIKIGLGILLVIIVVLAVSGLVGWIYISREHDEAKNLKLIEGKLSDLKDGTYTGKYNGGMYKWRENEVRIIVKSGSVDKIEVINLKENKNEDLTNELFSNVIKEQSLQVDTASGATLTSKAILKGIEDGIKKAQKK
ncbi:MAG: FMN-binding protein [Clostridiales bacterium]